MFGWRARVGAIPLYLTMSGLAALFSTMIFTITAVYRIEAAGLNPLQLVLVGTALELAAFLFEVPTGVVADVYSRRLSIIIGYVLIGAGFLLEGALPLFATILLAQVLWGVGWTFTSGAREAWLADEVGAERAAPVYLRASQAGLIGGLIGAPLGAGLGLLGLNLPILVGGGLFLLLALGLALVMPERGFRPTPTPARESWRTMGSTVGEGAALVRSQPVLLTLLGVAIFWGASSEGFDRLWAAHLLTTFGLPPLGPLGPVAWFGLLSVVTQLLGLAATELVRRRLDLNDGRAVARALVTFSGLLAAAVLVFALAGGFGLALAAYWVIGLLRAVNSPVTTAWLNQRLRPEVRATVLSMHGQADALGQIAGGPVLGAIGTLRDVRAAIIAAAVALLPAVLLYLRLLRRPRAMAMPAPGEPAGAAET